MAADMQKLIVTSEEDEEEDGTDMDLKEEDGDNDNRAKQIADQAMVGVDVGMLSDSFDSQFQYHQDVQDQVSTPGGGSGGRKCRPIEEKERTKLRERHRRAITARILAGLRRHGNYNLRVRADINDVIAALAREAGWVVLPDGTTFPSRSQGSRSVVGPSAAVTETSSHQTPQQEPPPSLKGISPGYPTSVEYNSGGMKSLLVPSPSPYDLSAGAHPQTSVMMGDGVDPTGIQPLTAGTVDTINVKQIVDVYPKLSEREFAGSVYVPVYVMLPLGVINMKCELADPDGLLQQLRALKSADVDGVKVDCWWGIVEAHAPQEYNWHGYKKLCQIVRQLKLKLQVIMSFHECGGNVGDDVCIPLPHWVAEIGRSNPDIFFTDKEGRRNPECLSWGIDKERVLRGRTAVEVYFDYMRCFRVEFEEFFEDGVISMVEIGLGPCGDLRYPSNPVKHGWRYPGIGEFQCYDQYLTRNLRKAAEVKGHPFWARVPDNCGSYNSQPHETGFFCDGGDYDGYHGRFFLNWYSQVLVDHCDLVLSLSKLAFEGTCMTAKLPSTHWWYKTASHAAELTAGFYNSCNRDGYAAIVAMLKKHGATLNFCFSDLGVLNQQPVDFADGYVDSDGLFWQVLNAAWDASIQVVSESVFPCHDRLAYNKILDNVKPLNDPDGRHSLSFAYHRLNSVLMERHNFLEFQRFVKRMHGEAVMEMHVQV